MEIGKGVYTVNLSGGKEYPLKVWILDCDKGVVLVDGGEAASDVDKIFSNLRSIRKNWRDVKLVLVTHKHADHTSNLGKIRDLTNARILAPKADAPEIEEKFGTKVEGLSDGEVIPFCGGIEVIWAPGHTEGNSSYYIRNQKLMIAGDTVFSDDEGNLTPPPEKYNSNTDQATKSIKRLLDYDFDTLSITHGPDRITDGKKKVKDLVNKRQ